MSCKHSNDSPWTEQLRDAPFQHSHFTEELKEQIRLKVSKPQKPTNRWNKKWLGTLVAALVIGIVILAIVERPADETILVLEQYEAIETRSSYLKNGQMLFEIFPGGEFVAGEPSGYMISFKEPFEVYRNKKLSIRATHVKSGLEETLVDGEMIKEPSSGYDTLARYGIPSMGVPLSGYWHYVIELDGELYGDAILEAKEPDWEISPEFTADTYELQGIENKLGILNPGFIANQVNKYMWFLWGGEELKGAFRVVAVKQGSNELLEIFSVKHLGGVSKDTAKRIPSGMSLPEPGLWRLMAYVDGKLFGNIIVEVQGK
ncbi:MAG: DUF4871 domain-containing protein [Candidatus Pristimantibacillus sp.]